MRRPFYLWFFLCLWAYAVKGQDSSRLTLSGNYLAAVAHKADGLSEKLDKKTERYVSNFKKAEQKLLRKLARKDPTKAKELLVQSQQKYQQLQGALAGQKPLQEYLPSLDTLTTSLKFLSQHTEWLAQTKNASEDLTQALHKVKGLHSSLGKAEAVNQFLQERKAQLATQLQGMPFFKEFKHLHQQAYYYKTRVEAYKALLKDKSQWERKALELLSKTKAFQSFMRQHSQLAALFRLPGGEGKGDMTSLEGLQTRAQVNSLLQERFGSDPSAIAQLRENVQAAQGQLNSLKSKAESLKSGNVGNTDNELAQPDFKPNSQKTKSFLQRLEVGTNIQTQKAKWLFPVTTDLGLSLGYKLNDNSIIGLGGSYKIGLGSSWQHISLTHQGVGLRSFIEYKLKGSLFISGGYEQNYRSEIKALEQLKDQSAWQQSGLIGLTKKYKVSKKLKGSMQLLWDFLSYQQIPRTQAVLFRIGYNLN